MRGRILAIVGALLVSAGVTGLYFAYEAQGFAAAVACWAAILAGAIALISGASQFMAVFMRPQQSVESSYGETEVSLLIQSMGAIAAADGNISETEVAMIAGIQQRILGLAMPPDRVRQILAEVGPGFDIQAALNSQREKLSPLMRQRIVKSCVLVMMSDLIEEKAEAGKILEIGRALGYSGDEIDDLIAMAGV